MIYEIEGVAKHRATRDGIVRALEGLSLSVRAGERVAVVGPSGAGKTTLFRLLNTTSRPTAGTVRFEGRDVASRSARELRAMRRRIGTIHQQHHLVPSLSVLENALAGNLGRWSLWQTIASLVRPAPEDRDRALAALELVGLGGKRRARADELSGGEQQRLGIARVLVQDPQVVLADEPVASLDPALAESVIALLVRVAAERGKTLVVTLHALHLARAHFPRIVALRRGRIAYDGPVGDSAGALTQVFRTAPDTPLDGGLETRLD